MSSPPRGPASPVRPVIAVLGLLLAVISLSGCGSSVGQGAATAATGPPDAALSGARSRTIPDGSWTQFNFNAARTGVGPADTGITAFDVKQLRRRTITLDGTVDASALALHAVRIKGHVRDVIVVTTTYGRTIALDATDGARLWEFAPPDVGRLQGSAQITNTTPIADGGYVYAASPDGEIHKLSLTTGRQVTAGGWPARVTLLPTREKLASALNISGGYLLVATDGYNGDIPPYQGHVVKISLSNGRIAAVWNSLCSERHGLIAPSSCPASDSAIWGRSGVVVEPGSRRLLLATSNGSFNGTTDWGDSVLELSESLRLLHNWTPTDQARLSVEDRDLGSTSPALLPVVHGLRLVVQGGKSGELALVDLNRLDGTTQPAGPRTGGQLQTIAAPGGAAVFSQPAVWSDRGRSYVFVTTAAGTAAYILGTNDRLSVLWRDATPGTSPVIAGGLLYIYDQAAGGIVIRRPLSERPLARLPTGSGHWNSPIVLGGRIIEPEGNANQHATTGVLDIYHLPGR